MNILLYEKSGDSHRYTIGLSRGRTAEVFIRLKRSGLQVDGGAVTGVEKNEEVSTFREAADWLSRFIEQDGAPRQDVLATFRPQDPPSP